MLVGDEMELILKFSCLMILISGEFNFGPIFPIFLRVSQNSGQSPNLKYITPI